MREEQQVIQPKLFKVNLYKYDNLARKFKISCGIPLEY